MASIVTAALVAPAFAEVHVGISIPAPPSIVITAPPHLVVVPGVPTVQYAPDVNANFFYYDNSYYTYSGGNWFIASSYNGPWVYVERVHVPRPLISVPGHYYRHGGPSYYGRSDWEHRRHDEHHGHVSYYEHGHGHPHGMPPGQAKKLERDDHGR
jgi:hypothetical protein